MGAGARWSKTREELAGEARLQAVPRGDREALFRTYVAEQDVRPLLSCRIPHFCTTGNPSA